MERKRGERKRGEGKEGKEEERKGREGRGGKNTTKLSNYKSLATALHISLYSYSTATKIDKHHTFSP